MAQTPRNAGREPSLAMLDTPNTPAEHDAGIDNLKMAMRFAVENDQAELERMCHKRRKVAMWSLSMLPACLVVFMGAMLYLKWTGRAFAGADAMLVIGPIAIIFGFILLSMFAAGRWGSEVHVVRAMHFQKHAERYAALFEEIARRRPPS